MKRKYNEVPLKVKLDALNQLEKGSSQRDIAAKLGVSPGTVANWSKTKESIQKAAAENANANSKRAVRVSGLQEVLDDRIYNWFAAVRSRNRPVSGPMLQTKAREVAECIGLDEFVASNGWLEKFRKRHNINCRVLSGESAEMNQKVVTNWNNNIMYLLRDTPLKNVFNFDETGLFYKGLPNKSLTLAGEAARGGKLAKERVTIGLLSSALGEKYKPIVIGKSLMPRAFKGHLPTSVVYRANKTAWMTSKLYSEYFEGFNKSMKSQNRVVTVIVDNAPCHPHIELSNVRFIFLPPNTTAGTQPMDAGIIKTFKHKYLHRILAYMIVLVSSQAEALKTINMKHAVSWISSAWDEVTTETIVNCFRKTGITETGIPAAEPALEEDDTLYASEVSSDVFEAASVVEKNIACFMELDEDWEAAILNPPPEEVDEDSEDDDTPAVLKPSHEDALKAVGVLQEYFSHEDLPVIKSQLNNIGKEILRLKHAKGYKSTTIDQYFK